MAKITLFYVLCGKSRANNYQLANFIKKIVAFLANWAIIDINQARYASQRCASKRVIFLWTK